MTEFLQDHYGVMIAIGLYTAVAMIQALPDPETQRFHFYTWFYHVAKSLLNAVPPQYKTKA